MHRVLSPLALIFASITPHIDSFSVDVMIAKFTVITRTVLPREMADPVFGTVAILATVLGSVRPSLNTLTMLLVIQPLANVLGMILAEVRSMAVCFVISPMTFIHFAICVGELALSVRFVVS